MTHSTERELGMRQIKPESKVVTPTDLKSSPGFFADLQKERERESQKKRETKGEWERCKFY